MGHKIFVSYKYSDTNVAALPGQVFSSARDYVTVLEHKLDWSSQIYKGESDGEDLSHLTEEQIWAKCDDCVYISRNEGAEARMVAVDPMGNFLFVKRNSARRSGQSDECCFCGRSSRCQWIV